MISTIKTIVMSERKPITNCHTHIFTGDHVPPLLGKTLMPFPLFYLTNIKWLIAIVRSANNGWLRKVYYKIKTPVDRFVFWWQHLTQHNVFSMFIAWLIKTVITAICFIFLSSFLLRFLEKGYLFDFITYIFKIPLFIKIAGIPIIFKIIILIISCILIKWVRRVVQLMLYAVFSFLKTIAGNANIQLLKRYYSIAMVSKDRSQEYIFRVLKKSYPDKSKFIVLPMDLDYIKAGKPKKDYLEQLEDLRRLKRNPTFHDELKPFVFADPRRIEENSSYYDTIIECLEKDKFSGIKIYPALGYYPFDKNLLKLYFYICKHEIPVLTHCIRGIIFYRGIKKTEWDHHPIFTETKNGKEQKMELKEFRNIDFINNFTHPLNYICLLDPAFLRIVLFDLKEGEPLTNELYTLYGFTKANTPQDSILTHDLKALKLCFGHFGGEDEWSKYIDKDLNTYDNKFQNNPAHFDMFKNPAASTWQRETWYSIIRNIIMNPDYPNVYADISFILYDEKIMALLKESLQVPKLQDRILYGTDFYVVRQKGTDKKFWIDIQSQLSKEEIERIAITNPATFIK